MKIVKQIKSLIKRVRMYFVVSYAERNYRKAVRLADERFKQSNRHYYVVINPIFGNRLSVMSRNEFRRIRRAYNDSMIRSFVRTGKLFRNYTNMQDIYDGCFYTTRYMSEQRREVGKRAYINWVIDLSERKKK